MNTQEKLTDTLYDIHDSLANSSATFSNQAYQTFIENRFEFGPDLGNAPLGRLVTAQLGTVDHDTKKPSEAYRTVTMIKLLANRGCKFTLSVPNTGFKKPVAMILVSGVRLIGSTNAPATDFTTDTPISDYDLCCDIIDNGMARYGKLTGSTSQYTYNPSNISRVYVKNQMPFFKNFITGQVTSDGIPLPADIDTSQFSGSELLTAIMYRNFLVSANEHKRSGVRDINRALLNEQMHHRFIDLLDLLKLPYYIPSEMTRAQKRQYHNIRTVIKKQGYFKEPLTVDVDVDTPEPSTYKERIITPHSQEYCAIRESCGIEQGVSRSLLLLGYVDPKGNPINQSTTLSEEDQMKIDNYKENFVKVVIDKYDPESYNDTPLWKLVPIQYRAPTHRSATYFTHDEAFRLRKLARQEGHANSTPRSWIDRNLSEIPKPLLWGYHPALSTEDIVSGKYNRDGTVRQPHEHQDDSTVQLIHTYLRNRAISPRMRQWRNHRRSLPVSNPLKLKATNRFLQLTLKERERKIRVKLVHQIYTKLTT